MQTQLGHGVERPDVSVLIVNYNVKDYLLQCLRSIEAGRHRVSAEVIVVDNASSDDSVESLRPLFPWVRWIPLAENIGFGRGNNVGLQECRGRYTLFLNPDTIVGQETLDVMVDYLDAHPDVGLAGCKVLNADGTFQVACRRGFPTPWASFCKLFGLQSMFPRSKVFAQYNQLFRSVDETYEVDALIGAFMMGPTSLINEHGGFDPDFFMYGEDLDLCYRIKRSGRKVMYVHTTSIVHFKGESTRRSSMNEIKVFFEAMSIFARKHYGRSRMFLRLLRTGIGLRAMLERSLRHRREIVTAVLDGMAVNVALMAATTIRFDGPLGFPDYAYPTVFIVVTAVVLLSLMSVGEYIEHRPTVRRSVVGLLVSFFVLSSLTYFFKEYAFSRGVLLMTIGFSAVFVAVIRGVWTMIEASVGSGKDRRIVLIGTGEEAERIVAALQTAEHRRAEVVGVIAYGPPTGVTVAGYPVLGTTDWIESIIADHAVSEVIVTDPTMGQDEAMRLMMSCAKHRARFHMATVYEDIVTARIINDVAGVEPTVRMSPLVQFRNRLLKRSMDLGVALFVLMLLGPALILSSSLRRGMGRRWFDVLRGAVSLVGLYPDGTQRAAGRPGLTGLVHISQPMALSPQAIVHLNDYYVDNYSLALDVEILLKQLLRRHRGQ